MLISCPECKLQVSDRAKACPHCGYPLTPEKKNIGVGNVARKRLPNGFGQISKIKNRNLQNPYRVLITVGKDASGKSVVKPLYPQSYFHTYQEAYEALVEFHLNPGEIPPHITVLELYYYWSKEHYARLTSDSAIRGFRNAWSKCTSAYNVKISVLTQDDIAKCMLRSSQPGMKVRVKTLFDLMLDFAVKKKAVEINIARTFTVKQVKN